VCKQCISCVSKESKIFTCSSCNVDTHVFNIEDLKKNLALLDIMDEIPNECKSEISQTSDIPDKINPPSEICTQTTLNGNNFKKSRIYCAFHENIFKEICAFCRQHGCYLCGSCILDHKDHISNIEEYSTENLLSEMNSAKNYLNNMT
jgi:hypothetical protein